MPIQFKQFMSWCPEAKLEGYDDLYPVIGGQLGTRNTLGMLLMSLGLVETVKLFDPKDWVTALKNVEQIYAKDAERRQQAWNVSISAAQQLHEQYHVGGVGVVGDILQKELSWNFWSQISLVVWDVPKEVDLWELQEDLAQGFDIDWIEPPHCTPAEWELITSDMNVLVGTWDASKFTPTRKRLQLFRKNTLST